MFLVSANITSICEPTGRVQKKKQFKNHIPTNTILSDDQLPALFLMMIPKLYYSLWWSPKLYYSLSWSPTCIVPREDSPSVPYLLIITRLHHHRWVMITHLFHFLWWSPTCTIPCDDHSPVSFFVIVIHLHHGLWWAYNLLHLLLRSLCFLISYGDLFQDDNSVLYLVWYYSVRWSPKMFHDCFLTCPLMPP